MSDYLRWLKSRREHAEKRLAQMVPIKPPSTPLMEMLRRQAASKPKPR